VESRLVDRGFSRRDCRGQKNSSVKLQEKRYGHVF